MSRVDVSKLSSLPIDITEEKGDKAVSGRALVDKIIQPAGHLQDVVIRVDFGQKRRPPGSRECSSR